MLLCFFNFKYLYLINKKTVIKVLKGTKITVDYHLFK